MSYFVQLLETGHQNDYGVQNYSGTDIPANYLVMVDTTYYLGNSSSPVGPADGIGVALPSGSGVRCIGVTLEIIKASAAGAGTAGNGGRVRFFGPQAVMLATAAIAINAQVMADGTTAGLVKTYTSSAVILGIALSQASTAQDQILIMLSTGCVAV